MEYGHSCHKRRNPWHGTSTKESSTPCASTLVEQVIRPFQIETHGFLLGSPPYSPRKTQNTKKTIFRLGSFSDFCCVESFRTEVEGTYLDFGVESTLSLIFLSFGLWFSNSQETKCILNISRQCHPVG